jgi:hypothetical protein
LMAGYRLFSVLDVVGGVDLLRYGFDFNPVAQNSRYVAGGGLDQYISGWLGVRLHPAVASPLKASDKPPPHRRD